MAVTATQAPLDRNRTQRTQQQQKAQRTGAEQLQQSQKLLKVGSKGLEVAQLQKALNDKGANLRVDGNFGPATRRAVRKYQRDNSLQVDGVVGPQTRGALSGQRVDNTDKTSSKRTQDAAGARPTAASTVTGEQLKKISPNLSPQKAEQFAKHLSKAMAEAGINTPKRKKAFLAQLAHESGGFRYLQELSSGRQYNGRRDLGNTQPGDGPRFKGRGFIQLTGRANYRKAGKALGLDLENNPQLAARPDVAARVAGWYWKSRGLNRLADRGDFRGITKRINGGYNGYNDRLAYLRRAQRVIA